MLKIIDNPDTELREMAEQQLIEMKEKYGKRYCPCALEYTQDTICLCKEFREKNEVGSCHCGRYYKINTDKQ